jgi:putative membrane-bound dehydrogenase-like protein
MHNALLWLAMAVSAPAPSEAIAIPKVVDPRLKIELFAADPDVATPTGIAVDARGRVLVVESHTHFRPPGYEGPPADRIRMFEDTDGDGKADRITTFFEGTTWTMNLGIHPDGSVYVATRGEIFRLRDTDNDGHADERTPIVHLETKGDYPHNGLSGFAFDYDGTVYFGLGENKGAEFKLIGTDGSTASELEGGQVYRCRADGTRLEMIAFGFWNPFHLAFDTFGRLFAVDNDPDSLPPCRLMHIVSGGNYGYRYRNGRKGVHPFTAWNGELPGTLPMVAGTGEAPSGVLAYESDQFPAEYVGDLLATSWGDHRIERFHLEPRGASFRSVMSPVVTGDENFRPVGIAVAPDGSLFVSDWVLKSYEVHGKGRIWHLSAAEKPGPSRPQSPAEAIHAAHRPLRENAARQLAADVKSGRPLLEELAAQDASPRTRALAIAALSHVQSFSAAEHASVSDRASEVRAAAIRALPPGLIAASLLAPEVPAEARAEAMRRPGNLAHAHQLWQAVADNDAFVAQAAREGLARLHAASAEAASSRSNPAERLACLLILRETRDSQGRSALPKLLRDTDANVRFAAVQWVGEERLLQFRAGLADALAAGPASSRLFGGYLAALERLDGVVRSSDDEWAGEQYIVRALEDPTTSPDVRRWALRMLRPDHPLLSVDRLRQFVASGDAALQLEAVRTLRDCRHPGRVSLLCQIAADEKYRLSLRAEAIVGLSGDESQSRSLLVSLASLDEPTLRDEALRSLRGSALDENERTKLVQIARDRPQTAELVELVINPSTVPKRPNVDDLSGWRELIDGSDTKAQGDAAAGERIFFQARAAGCSRCHQIAGRGARVGPELTATAGALSRERLIESIMRPSKEIAPQFSSWTIVTTTGKTMVGMLVKEEATGEQTFADQKGELFRFQPGEIESRQAQSVSIMPDGLPQLLTVQEFRDLLAFMQSPQSPQP